jgi:hypothetical protein
MFMSYFPWQQIRDSKRMARRAGSDASKASHSTQEMALALDHLSLTCMAMWERLRESGGHTDEELLKRMAEIDLRDGVMDGKVRVPPRDCSSCGRKNNVKRSNCLYCGQTFPGQAAFPTNPGASP